MFCFALVRKNRSIMYYFEGVKRETALVLTAREKSERREADVSRSPCFVVGSDKASCLGRMPHGPAGLFQKDTRFLPPLKDIFLCSRPLFSWRRGFSRARPSPPTRESGKSYRDREKIDAVAYWSGVFARSKC